MTRAFALVRRLAQQKKGSGRGGEGEGEIQRRRSKQRLNSPRARHGCRIPRYSSEIILAISTVAFFFDIW